MKLHRTARLALAAAVVTAFAAEPAKSTSGSAVAKSTKKAAPAPLPFVPASTGLEFIDTSFENASPVWYEQAPDQSILVYLMYDHERASPNRAAGHVHILLQAKPGSKLTLEFKNLENVYNGARGSIAREVRTMVISEDGRTWKAVPLESLPGDRIRLAVEMPGPRLYVARIEPYRISDLDTFLAAIRKNPLVHIAPIGRTVQGRELELVRVGYPQSPYRVFLRARAHPWEPGGNWVVQGLVNRLLRGDADAQRFLERTCVYVMPMANKDGVAHGRTRFNFQGKDLNRDWNRPADTRHAPENVALEKWLEGMIAAGQKPHLAVELHNDGNGRLHISGAPVPELARYRERMVMLEALLRRHTWFTEGSTNPAFRNAGTLGDGWLERYQIDGVVHEFSSNWIAGLKDYPSGKHWETYGANLATVFHEYFGTIKP
ncbi:MAG: peptidase M14 [Verrucomicrobia bacterium]|nr:peptidase M14 [Verrucomicrobiota bacterium]